MTARIQMFLSNEQTNMLQLEQIFDVYKKEIAPLFHFDETQRENFVISKVRELQRHFEDEEDAYEHACELLFMREKMGYQHRCFVVTQLYSVFEQQVLQCFRGEVMRGNFVTSKDKTDKPAGSPYSYSEFNDNAQYAIKWLEKIKNSDEAWFSEEHYDCIVELSNLNNAIKHGLGKSFNTLKDKSSHLINTQKFVFEEQSYTPKDFVNRGNKEFKTLAQSTLFDEVFLLTDEKVEAYKNLLVDFWYKSSVLLNGFHISI
ncbi:hypothetical protein [Marinomonas posidonica]|uniref:hypothetical protein n=1 Tax=Marinomonas posidonica TaxID=936476 RepID=UPI0037355FAA